MAEFDSTNAQCDTFVLQLFRVAVLSAVKGAITTDNPQYHKHCDNDVYDMQPNHARKQNRFLNIITTVRTVFTIRPVPQKMYSKLHGQDCGVNISANIDLNKRSVTFDFRPCPRSAVW